MGPRSAVLALGLRSRANTADLIPVTGPIQNYLINNIIVFTCVHSDDFKLHKGCNLLQLSLEPYHEKTCLSHMQATKAQISLCIRPV